MKRFVLFCFMLYMASGIISAQGRAKDFYISSFKALEMDLDARTLHPVVDQNGKKAALIKVVTIETGFDFDIGMMGITEVHQEVGEIWVYIPERAQRMTIRHNEFGVIRDYYFPLTIESATVYEMILVTPPREKAPKTIIVEHKFPTTTPAAISRIETTVSYDTPSPKKRGNILIMPQMGVGRALSYGAMVGYFKKFGGYVNFRSAFDFTPVSYQCTSEGNVLEGGIIWTTGQEKRPRLNITAGAIVGFTDWFAIYAGAGYGSSLLIWEDVNKKWAEVEDYSCKGVALDIGAMFCIGKIALSIGVNSVNLSSMDFTFGVGVNF